MGILCIATSLASLLILLLARRSLSEADKLHGRSEALLRRVGELALTDHVLEVAVRTLLDDPSGENIHALRQVFEGLEGRTQ